MKLILKVVESKCRSNYHIEGDTFVIDDLCPPICHELWQCIYPSVYALKNGATLDNGNIRTKQFRFRCPDQGRVVVEGSVLED